MCDNLCPITRKSLILNGEMSEWLKEHAWKSTRLARADAYEIPPTHFPINNFPNIDARRRVPVSCGVAPGFQGACDTVLTQFRSSVAPTCTKTYRRVPSSRLRSDAYQTRRYATRDQFRCRTVGSRCASAHRSLWVRKPLPCAVRAVEFFDCAIVSNLDGPARLTLRTRRSL